MYEVARLVSRIPSCPLWISLPTLPARSIEIRQEGAEEEQCGDREYGLSGGHVLLRPFVDREGSLGEKTSQFVPEPISCRRRSELFPGDARHPHKLFEVKPGIGSDPRALCAEGRFRRIFREKWRGNVKKVPRGNDRGEPHPCVGTARVRRGTGGRGHPPRIMKIPSILPRGAESCTPATPPLTRS